LATIDSSAAALVSSDVARLSPTNLFSGGMYHISGSHNDDLSGRRYSRGPPQRFLQQTFVAAKPAVLHGRVTAAAAIIRNPINTLIVRHDNAPARGSLIVGNHLVAPTRNEIFVVGKIS
jgi:hypothetical protein